jgi:hypothetical protein
MLRGPGRSFLSNILDVYAARELARRVPFGLAMKMLAVLSLDQPAHQSNTAESPSNRPEAPDFAEGTKQRPTPGGRLTLGAELERGRARIRLDATGGKALATVIALGALVALVVALCRVLH